MCIFLPKPFICISMTANIDMSIAFNGPKVGEADETKKKALDRKFGGRGEWHFSTKQNLFRTGGITVENIKKGTYYEHLQ